MLYNAQRVFFYFVVSVVSVCSLRRMSTVLFTMIAANVWSMLDVWGKIKQASSMKAHCLEREQREG